jgi:hypothetical protein
MPILDKKRFQYHEGNDNARNTQPQPTVIPTLYNQAGEKVQTTTMEQMIRHQR